MLDASGLVRVTDFGLSIVISTENLGQPVCEAPWDLELTLPPRCGTARTTHSSVMCGRSASSFTHSGSRGFRLQMHTKPRSLEGGADLFVWAIPPCRHSPNWGIFQTLPIGCENGSMRCSASAKKSACPFCEVDCIQAQCGINTDENSRGPNLFYCSLNKNSCKEPSSSRACPAHDAGLLRPPSPPTTGTCKQRSSISGKEVEADERLAHFFLRSWPRNGKWRRSSGCPMRFAATLAPRSFLREQMKSRSDGTFATRARSALEATPSSRRREPSEDPRLCGAIYDVCPAARPIFVTHHLTEPMLSPLDVDRFHLNPTASICLLR